MEKHFILIGSILGGVAVVAGAFGAHGLKNVVSREGLEIWEKAVSYQMYHALTILFLAWIGRHWPAQIKIISIGGWFFLAGVILFSGSLYGLVLSQVRWLGMITPVGGVAFVVGWVCLLIAAWRQ